ncbi:MAG: substrate-binding domain-containing protein [Ferruginibacter sp.]|nr:substrate-binding domain-containing protein [Ferruginibacter sp.]
MLANKEVVIEVEHCSNTQDARDITQKYFSKKTKPEAVFCMSDEILIGVMKTLNELKIAIPATTGVIALSDGFFPTIYTPEITYIETSGYKLGKLAFKRMINCMTEKTGPSELYTDSPFINGGSI